MNKKTKKQFIISFSLIILFILFTLSLKIIDVQPIGQKGTNVAYAKLNSFVSNLFGLNLLLYDITDWAGLVVLFIPLGFVIIGLIQLIKRKSLFKVDKDILVLGVFYIVVTGLYFLSNNVVLNYRPVLINGCLEPSYPSSTTLKIMCIIPTFNMQIKSRVSNKKAVKTITIISNIFMVLMVALRLISGVHWFTDILGGIIISCGLVLLYGATISYINN